MNEHKFTMEPEDFLDMAVMMMKSSPAKATAAFAGMLSEQYPLEDQEDDEE